MPVCMSRLAAGCCSCFFRHVRSAAEIIEQQKRSALERLRPTARQQLVTADGNVVLRVPRAAAIEGAAPAAEQPSAQPVASTSAAAEEPDPELGMHRDHPGYDDHKVCMCVRDNNNDNDNDNDDDDDNDDDIDNR